MEEYDEQEDYDKASVKIFSLINNLNEIHGLINILDTTQRQKPYTSKALITMNSELDKYHNNLKNATEVIQLLEPVMQKYKDMGYSVLCEPSEYYDRKEWKFHLKYCIIREHVKFAVSLYVKDTRKNAVETVIRLSMFPENGETYSGYGSSLTVAKMSMDTFKKSADKYYDKLIHDVCALFDNLDNFKLFKQEFENLKIAKK